MSLGEKIKDFAGSIGLAATRAPDNYGELSSWNYEDHMADLKELWSEIQPQIKRDFELSAFIEEKLQEIFNAFEAGEIERGRSAAWAIYNSEFKKMR